MIREDSPQTHCPCMQDGFVAETTQTAMAMHNLNLFSYNNVAKYWEEGEDGGKSRCTIDDEERNMVDLEPVREVSDSSSSFVCMSDYNDLVPSIDEFGGELVDVAFDAAGLGEEEVADHRNIIRCSVCVRRRRLGP